jgi:hypothetical protein
VFALGPGVELRVARVGVTRTNGAFPHKGAGHEGDMGLNSIPSHWFVDSIYVISFRQRVIREMAGNAMRCG